MKIAINNRQKQIKIHEADFRRLIRFLFASASKLLPDRKWSEVSVVLVDNKGILPLNILHLNSKESTDVISFCYPPIPGSSEYSGEFFLNVERAVEISKKINWSVSRELSLYTAHACDHLMGQTDSTKTGMMKMRRRELKWLAQAEKMDLIEGITSKNKHVKRKINV